MKGLFLTSLSYSIGFAPMARRLESGDWRPEALLYYAFVALPAVCSPRLGGQAVASPKSRLCLFGLCRFLQFSDPNFADFFRSKGPGAIASEVSGVFW